MIASVMFMIGEVTEKKRQSDYGAALAPAQPSSHTFSPYFLEAQTI